MLVDQRVLHTRLIKVDHLKLMMPPGFYRLFIRKTGRPLDKARSLRIGWKLFKGTKGALFVLNISNSPGIDSKVGILSVFLPGTN